VRGGERGSRKDGEENVYAAETVLRRIRRSYLRTR